MPTHVYSVRTLLPWSIALLSAGAIAQTTPPSQASPTGATLSTKLQYKSAISRYQAYADQEVQSWREANDRVGRIGGWRAYAKEISTGESAKEAPTSSDPHSGHHEGQK